MAIIRLIRRFRYEFFLSILFTIVSIGLATGGGGKYSRDLAILTATLIALIWYTFFTYCALFRTEESLLNSRIRRSSVSRLIEIEVENPTKGRRITFQWHLSGWRNHQPMSIEGSLAGSSNQWFVLLPGELRSENVPISPLANKPGSHIGASVDPGEPEEAIIRLEVTWRDDLGDRGRLPTDYWAINLHDCSVMRFQDLKAAKQRWIELGGKP